MIAVQRVVVVATVAFISLIGLAGQAHAHTGLETSSPADGEVLTEAPEAITLTFSGAIAEEFVQLAVTGPDGQSINSAPATVEGSLVRQPVTAQANGAYVVAYRVVSSDGHPVSGQLTFSLQSAGASESTAAPSQPTASPNPSEDITSAEPQRLDEADNTGFAAMPGLFLTMAIVAVTMTGLVVFLVRRRTK